MIYHRWGFARKDFAHQKHYLALEYFKFLIFFFEFRSKNSKYSDFVDKLQGLQDFIHELKHPS